MANDLCPRHVQVFRAVGPPFPWLVKVFRRVLQLFPRAEQAPRR